MTDTRGHTGRMAPGASWGCSNVIYYYIALETRTHAFLLERRMKMEDVECEITYMPRQLMTGLCNMGVRFDVSQLSMARSVLRRCGLPGCRLYKEILEQSGSLYVETDI